MEKSSTDVEKHPLRITVGEHEDKVRHYAEANGVRVYNRGSSCPICALARVLAHKGVDCQREAVIVGSDGRRRMWGASLGWWADRNTTERQTQSVRFVKHSEEEGGP